jgi:hypothetical protein
MRLTASEKAGHPREKASARLRCGGRRIRFGKLFLERTDSTLRAGNSLLHHKKALDQQVRRRRNLSDLVSNQLISLGIFALAARLAEPIEQTGYEITFFGCHSLKKTLFFTLTSPDEASSKAAEKPRIQEAEKPRSQEAKKPRSREAEKPNAER